MDSKGILRVKTSVPPQPGGLLRRPHIDRLMDEDLVVHRGFTRRLTLISAPAGSGKTSAVRAWLRDEDYAIAWYSIDEGDDDPTQFWLYLVSALSMHSESVGRSARDILLSNHTLAGQPEPDTLLSPLLNDLFSMDHRMMLILDDYHHIHDLAIQTGMQFFIENLPPNVHLVVMTRSDPPWPLSRWRARGQMIDLRMEDLRFSADEVRSLLCSKRGFALDDAQIQALHAKADGWITGLHLASLSLARSEDPASFVREFAGSDRDIFLFLSEEVLGVQDEERLEFLMKTSVSDHLCASLCDAIVGSTGSGEILEGIRRDNLFLTPLDNRGHWYRYHPLFADLLRYTLKRRRADIVPSLHTRAARWWQNRGEFAEAVSHWIEAGDPRTLADVLEDNFEEILGSCGPGPIFRGLDAIPDEVLADHPELAIQKAYFRLIHRGGDDAMYYLDLAERAVANSSRSTHHEGRLAAVRTYYHIYANRLDEALNSAAQSLRHLSPSDVFWTTSISVLSGDIHLFGGNPRLARSTYAPAHEKNVDAGNLNLSISTGFKLATSLYHLGRRHEAEPLVRNLWDQARREGLESLPRAGLLLGLLGEIRREDGAMATAGEELERGISISRPEKPSFAWNLLHRVALQYSRREHAAALETLDEIDAVNDTVGMPAFITFRSSFWRARLLWAMGDLDRALFALSEAGVSPGEAMVGGKETGFLVMARIQLDRGEGDDALQNQLCRVKDLARNGGAATTLFECLVLLASWSELRDDLRLGNPYLLEALEVARRSRFHQTIVDRGDLLKRRLEEIDPSLVPAPSSAYFLRVKSLFRADESAIADPESSPGTPDSGAVEPLTERELEILALLAAGESNPNIAGSLHLSVGTVKWHTSNIYGKLGVRNRTEASVRAREEGLISPQEANQ